MGLETGTYIIISQLTKQPIGIIPEGPIFKVVTLPGGVHAPFWKITKEGDGLYQIKEGPNVAVALDGLLFASGMHVGRWKIQDTPQYGDRAHIITVEDFGGSSAGWTVTQEEANSQLAVKPSVIFPTPPGEIFDLLRVDRED